MGANTSTTWPELSGSKDWVDLLDPLDDDLRKYIIHYGEAAQAIGDAFNNEDRSEARGFSRYPMDVFFPSVGLGWFQYNVTQFFYARSVLEVNWVGYVAVATDEGKERLGRRDILVVWRGTTRTVEAVLDVDDSLVSASDILGGDHGDVMMHKGWRDIYTSKNGLIFPDYTVFSAGEQVIPFWLIPSLSLSVIYMYVTEL